MEEELRVPANDNRPSWIDLAVVVAAGATVAALGFSVICFELWALS